MVSPLIQYHIRLAASAHIPTAFISVCVCVSVFGVGVAELLQGEMFS